LGGSGSAATFTGGSGGTLYVPTPGSSGIPTVITFDSAHSYNATFTLSPISATSGAVAIPGGDVDETMTGGTFSFSDGATTYLSGSFTDAFMTTASHGTAVGVLSSGANSVTYTGGTFLSLAGISPGTIGAFSLGFSGADSGKGTGVGVGGGFISGWSANGFSGTFSALSGSGPGGGPGVPEPSGLAAFSIAGLLIAGALAVRKKGRAAAVFA